MKKTIVLFLFLFLRFSELHAQKPEPKNVKKDIKYGNYYSLFHERIKDTVHKSVLRFGNYVFMGAGQAMSHGWLGLGAHLSITTTYKSHFLSFTAMKVIKPGFFNNKGFDENHFSVTIGESIRTSFTFIGLSAGVANTTYSYWYMLPPYNHWDPQYYNSGFKTTLSMPIELRISYQRVNFFGIGALLSYNYVPKSYSGFYLGCSLVTGVWKKRVN